MSLLHPLVAPWLARVASRERERFVVRGSLLTATWCPGRPTEDVDHLLVGLSSIEAAREAAHALAAGAPFAIASEEVIWADTPLPGLRLRLVDPSRPEVAELQVDLGWGDPLTLPPAPLEIAGVPVLGVRPETMVGWKTHGLVEFGGKWRPKDLLDITLLARLPLAHDDVVAATYEAFSSRGASPELLRRFLWSGEWGRSRGSRRKWETFAKRWKGSSMPPAFDEVVRAARVFLGPIGRALGVEP